MILEEIPKFLYDINSLIMQDYNIVPDEYDERTALENADFFFKIDAFPLLNFEDIHELWVQDMKEKGWTWGLNIDYEKKKNPFLVDYIYLPIWRKRYYEVGRFTVDFVLKNETAKDDTERLALLNSFAQNVYDLNINELGNEEYYYVPNVKHFFLPQVTRQVEYGIERRKKKIPITLKDMHEIFSSSLTSQGFVYGARDFVKKTYPGLVPFEKTPKILLTAAGKNKSFVDLFVSLNVY